MLVSADFAIILKKVGVRVRHWYPAHGKEARPGMLTRHGEKLDKAHPLPEYPRPQLLRDSYLNLNGVWRYAITREAAPPEEWDGGIVVPYCPESLLSGVLRAVGPEDVLWYRRHFSLPPGFMKDHLLLHFGAVDQTCTVWLNGRQAGRHEGGYLPFALDVTALLREGEQELTVMVTDPTEAGPHARGYQKLANGGAWHRAVSGIWQTVWLESVPRQYVHALRVTPLYDENCVEILVESRGGVLEGSVEVFANATFTAGGAFRSGKPLRLRLPGALSWSPKMPFLYTLKVSAGADYVESYFGMRKLGLGPGPGGRQVLYLNNKPFKGAGVLDAGLYSDGLYTPASDAAMKDDLRYARESGFNMLRKIGKIEPLRWYYHCDKMGLLVWQDLPGGGGEPKAPPRLEQWFGGRNQTRDDAYERFGRQDAGGREAFVRDMERTAALLNGLPCLSAFVLFREGYGQFDSAANAALLQEIDPGRLVVAAAGQYAQGGGSFACPSLYSYKKPLPLPDASDGRALALGEAGGFGLVPQGHFAGAAAMAPTLVLNSREEFAEAIANLYKNHLLPLGEAGLSLFFFTRLADTEDDMSGLLSYDRRVRKLHTQGLATLNRMFTG